MPLGIGMGLSVGAGNGLPLSSSWPSVSDIPPGMLVLDSDGVVKQKRFAVELNGPDSLRFSTSTISLSTTNWSLSWTQSDRAVSAIGNRLLGIYDGERSVVRINQITGGYFRLTLSTDGSNAVAYIDHTNAIVDTRFHSFRIEKIGDNIALIIDGVSVSTSIGTWSATNASIVEFKDSGIDLRPLVLANIKQCDSVSCNDFFPCTEQAGTEIANINSPNRPATLSDATAHTETLVPVSML